MSVPDRFKSQADLQQLCSIIRLYTIKVFASSKDPFYDGVPINIWSMIEVNVAIICASVPGKTLPLSQPRAFTDIPLLQP